MPERRDESFPGHCRLRKSNDFRRVFVKGKRNATRYFVLYSLPNHLDFPRLGIQVKRKIGTAVKRNYLKRIARETFRKAKSEFQIPVDLVLIVEKEMTTLGYQQFERIFRAALQPYLR